MPGIASHVKYLSDLVALAAHDLWFQLFASFINPLSTSQFDPFLTFRAPCVWMRIGWVMLGPEETNTLTLDQPGSNVLTYKGLRLWSVGFAANRGQSNILAVVRRHGSAPTKQRLQFAQLHTISLTKGE